MSPNQRCIWPKPFGLSVAADQRRSEFNYHNEVIVYKQQPVDCIFFGDSITHWWELPAYFQSRFSYVVNRGISGDTTEWMLKRFDADVLQLKPKKLVILAGINNTWMLDAVFPDEPKTYTQLQQEIVEDLSLMSKKAVQAGIEVYLCSILPVHMTHKASNDVRKQLVLDINRDLSERAKQIGVTFVNYHPHLTAKDGLSLHEQYSYDGLHPNVLGYDIMANVLNEAFDQA